MRNSKTIKTQKLFREKFFKFAGPIAFLGTMVPVIFVRLFASSNDFYQFVKPIKAFLSFRWSEIYTDGSEATSMTGWLFFVGIPSWFLNLTNNPIGAYSMAALLTIPLTFFAFKFAFHSLWPNRSQTQGWLLALLAVSLPSTLSAWVEFYHPQDVAGTAFVMFAIGFAAKQKWSLAGVLFGVAIMTRQWALLIAIPVAGLSGKHLWKYVLGGAVSSVSLLLPIAITGNEAWFEMLTFRSDFVALNSIIGTFMGISESNPPTETLITVGRAIPVVISIIAGLFFYWKTTFKKVVFSPTTFVAIAILGVILRILFEFFNFAYYWAPVAVLFLLLVPAKKAIWFFVALFAITPWTISFFIPYRKILDGSSLSSLNVGLTLMLCVTAIMVAWSFVRPDKPSMSETEILETDTLATGEKLKKPKQTILAWTAVALLYVGLFGLFATETIRSNGLDSWRENEAITNKLQKGIASGQDSSTILTIEEMQKIGIDQETIDRLAVIDGEVELNVR